jgi:hypothetical protein
MRITIEAGTRGWFEVQFNGLDSLIFNQDTTVELERCGTYWYKTRGQIPDFPAGHPGILINELYLPENHA